MWPYSWTHVGTPSHLGHMDRVAATMPSQAHAGAAQEAPNIGQWEGQDVPLVRPSSCTVKGGIPSSRRYLPTYLPTLLGVLCCMCGVLGHWAPVHRCACCVRCACAMGGCVPLPPPPFFFLLVFFFFGKKKRKRKNKKEKNRGTRTLQAQAWAAGAAVQ